MKLKFCVKCNWKVQKYEQQFKVKLSHPLKTTLALLSKCFNPQQWSFTGISNDIINSIMVGTILLLTEHFKTWLKLTLCSI